MLSASNLYRITICQSAIVIFYSPSFASLLLNDIRFLPYYQLQIKMITNISRQLTTGALAIAGTVAALGLGLVGSGAANAATLTYSFTNAEQSTEINQTNTLSKFDSSLGTLTGVALTLSGRATQNFSGVNTVNTTQTASITSMAYLSFTFSDGITITNPDNGDPAFTFSSSSGSQTYSANQTRNFGPYTPSSSKVYNFPATGNSALSNFLGAAGSTFSVTCTSMSGLTVMGGGGNITASQSTTAGCGASVQYTYTPASPPLTIPEPSGVLGIFAVAGVGFFLRRKS
ncbi:MULTISPECIES: choice-of-anchor E domain-containing protein [Microcystis]|uniref:choice-of-anchor E domain-containing protein n=1 Tax=Microcystis TaxID=1125 RepID=UPI0012303EF4|nr:MULTISPECIES: choice-of-anchor E domain-containing protein [Microcystis]